VARRKPYSVVLLDEVEKAHPNVHEIFFQVFDKGWVENAEGHHIDFRNTLILLTTNVGTDLVMGLCKDPELMPEPEGIATALRQSLAQDLPRSPAGAPDRHPLITRWMLTTIIRLQLGRIAERCREVESGAWVVDAIFTNTVLPAISREILERTLAGDELGRVGISTGEDGFEYAFD